VGHWCVKTKLLQSRDAAQITSAACLSFADGSFAASFWYVGMLFLKSSTQSLRLGRSLHHKQARSELSLLSRPSRMTMWQSPVFLDLVIVNCLRIIRAYVKLGQRKLARVQVFQVTGHRSCIRVCRWPECSHICVLTQAGLRLNCRTYMSGQALQFRFNVNTETRVVSELVPESCR